jgi:hypothetical protein
VVVAAGLYFVWLGPAAPPGFIRDEASVSYNAYTLSQNLHDQNGALTPLYIKSFGDYKSPLFVYVLAGVFRITGPSRHVALATAGLVVFAAILVLGLLAWRLTRSRFVVAATVVLAALTPWLWELGRTAYDTVIEPLAIACVTLAAHWGFRSSRHWLVRAVPLGLALAALSYSYAAGRLLSPLWAAALVVFMSRDRVRWLLATWGVYVLLMTPLVVYAFVHSGALSARYQSTTYVTNGMSTWTIAREFWEHYVHDGDLGHWVVSGDPKPYIHVHGAAQLFIATLALAALGLIVILRRHRDDRFWWFVIAALLLSPVPAALTADRYYSLRLLPLPLLLTVLAIPGLDLIRRGAVRDWAPRLVVVGVGLLVAAQYWQWRHNYVGNNGGRAELFEADVPSLLQRGFANRRTVYIDHDDVYAQTMALWYAASHDLPTSRVSILPDGGRPAKGSIAFGRLQTCDYSCTHFAAADTYWLARAN